MSGEWIGPSISSAGDIGAAIVGSAANKKEGKRAWRRTKVLNQNQVQWRVRDAQAAGISPLVAMGMSPIGPMPTSTGNVMADGISNAAQAWAQYADKRAGAAKAEELHQAALTESQARTEASRAGALRDLAEADYTNQQSLASILARVKSPGSANKPGNAHAAQGYSDMHMQMYRDIDPKATPGGVASIQTPWGPFEVNTALTPVELIEAIRGELPAEVFGGAFTLHDMVRNRTPDIQITETLGEILKYMPLDWLVQLTAKIRENEPVMQWKKGPMPGGNKLFRFYKKEKKE